MKVHWVKAEHVIFYCSRVDVNLIFESKSVPAASVMKVHWVKAELMTFHCSRVNVGLILGSKKMFQQV